MTNAVLAALQANWGIPAAQEDIPQTPALAQEPVQAEAAPVEAPVNSCTWVGQHVLGCVSTDLASDVARLKEIMWTCPIRPHLNEGGGAGYTHPHEVEWVRKYAAVLVEFEQLWWSAAGDVIVKQWGHHMPVRPQRCRTPDPAPPDNPDPGGSFPTLDRQGSERA